MVRLGYYGISIWEGILAPAVETFSREISAPHAEHGGGIALRAPRRGLLQEGQLDVALLGSGDYDRIPGVVTELACTVPAMAVVAANHRLAKKRLVTIEDLRDEQIIGFKHQDAPGRCRTFIAACRDAGFSPRRSLYVASIFPEVTMEVKKRMGAAILSSFATTVPHPGVVFLKLKPPCVPLEMYAAHILSGPPEARELAEMIIAQARRATSPRSAAAIRWRGRVATEMLWAEPLTRSPRRARRTIFLCGTQEIRKRIRMVCFLISLSST